VPASHEVARPSARPPSRTKSPPGGLSAAAASNASSPPGTGRNTYTVDETALADLREVASSRRLRCLLISLYDGIGCCAAAFEGLPVDLTVLTSEIDADCLAVLAHRYPDAHQLGDMTAISRSELAAHLVRVRPDLVLFSAGAPCQQPSELSANTVLDKQFNKFCDLVHILKFVSELLSQADPAIPLFFLFENVVTKDCWTAPREAALGYDRVIVDAATFGWHHRRREWLANPTSSASSTAASSRSSCAALLRKPSRRAAFHA
jgi:hypothetical protein